MNLEEKFRKLTNIGIALSGERDLWRLLTKIVTEARLFTSCQGGSLYLREGDSLQFAVSQNEVLGRNRTLQRVKFDPDLLPMNSNSIAGHVAMTGVLLNIPDVYRIPDTANYRFNCEFDRQNQYRTQSMLLVPMKDTDQETIGVLALINAKNDRGAVVPFAHDYDFLIFCLASQAAVAIKNIQLNKKLKEAYLDTLIRLSMAAECKDQNIGGHLQRISIYSSILAEAMALSADEVDNLRYASPMHDVGKIGIPDSILRKPSKLTPEEYEIMKQHTVYGAKILGNGSSPIIRLSEQIALTHHEKFDGSGYPQQLKGEAIPLPGRIVALADVFDALTSRRAYKEPWDFNRVVAYIREHSGMHFDPVVVEAFESRLVDFMEAQHSAFAPFTPLTFE